MAKVGSHVCAMLYGNANVVGAVGKFENLWDMGASQGILMDKVFLAFLPKSGGSMLGPLVPTVMFYQ